MSTYTMPHFYAGLASHFSMMDRDYERRQEKADAEAARLEIHALAYWERGDFYDAIGAVKDGEAATNALWAAIRGGDWPEAAKIADRIMEEAAEEYAELEVLREEEKPWWKGDSE